VRDAAAEGELPAAASTPPPSPPVDAELSRGVARSASACWWSRDPGGGDGGRGGGGCSCCCWPAAKTTLLSNVDHFMVPTPHPARRSRPDPADSPKFRRDSPAPLVLPNDFFPSRCSSPPPPARRLRPPIFCCRLLLVFSLPRSFPFFFPFRLFPHALPLSPALSFSACSCLACAICVSSVFGCCLVACYASL
jgi:hypothetical protein